MKKITMGGLLIVMVAVGLFTFSRSDAALENLQSVEMSVSRLSCGSCVETIRGAVTALNGTGKVETDVASARSYVEFDAQQIDAQQIASTITGSGYPATVLFVRNSAGAVISGIDLELFMARVGSRMITRKQFQQAFQTRLEVAETSSVAAPVRVVSSEAWQTLLRQELFLNAAEQLGVVVSDDDIARRAEDSGLVLDDIARENLRNQIMADRFLSMQFPDREPNGVELANLLNGLRSSTAVDIFDDRLRQVLSSKRAGSGCGGACCG